MEDMPFDWKFGFEYLGDNKTIDVEEVKHNEPDSSVIKPIEFITCVQSVPINVKFCLIAIANKKENKVAPMSIKNITHLGTILKFLNMNLSF